MQKKTFCFNLFDFQGQDWFPTKPNSDVNFKLLKILIRIRKVSIWRKKAWQKCNCIKTLIDLNSRILNLKDYLWLIIQAFSPPRNRRKWRHQNVYQIIPIFANVPWNPISCLTNLNHFPIFDPFYFLCKTAVPLLQQQSVQKCEFFKRKKIIGWIFGQSVLFCLDTNIQLFVQFSYLEKKYILYRNSFIF
jgi:hypothetical protein